MRKQLILGLTSLVIGASLVGCATTDPNQRTKIGAGIGAVTGAVIGNQVGGSKTRVGGAVVGAVVGGALGQYMDRQQQEMEQRLAEEQRSKEIEIQRVREDTLKLNLSSEVSFDVGKADIKPAFYGSLDKLADVIAQYDQTTVSIVGHTDSTGSDASNQILSERRAASVGSYLIQRGVSASRISTSGRGESEPRGDNATADGRQINRRVEVFLTSTGQ
ncbi:MAG: OmpA family protein [Thiotrichales bacterium]